METGTEDWGLTRRPTLASSWEAACGALTQSLLLSRAGLGAPDFDWEELLAPPAPGQDLVILKRSLSSQDENPCFLYLRCDPKGGEEIVSIGILSSARNMEVYLGEEYCGTCRGKNVCTVLDNRAAKKPDAVAVNNNRSEVMRDKVSLAKVTQCKAIPTESCRALQCCDQCRLYGNCDSLPSCCCDVNEGL
ncbi:ATPase PAAT-like isoform X1 [Cynocephalus volans]|uniref:ATPase PAAT-like isoform X1 n=1 Tax=Cynocephalus volans TaxID=110931 RepID=UPI002FC5AD15